MLVGLVLLAACTDPGLPEADDGAEIKIAVEVLFQFGTYNIGDNIDRFVTGPAMVIYGDGTTYSQFPRGNGDDPSSFLRIGQLDDDKLRDLVGAARDLPDDVSGRLCAEDEFQNVLVVESRTWSACGMLDADHLGPFIDAVRAEFERTDSGPWTPASWIQLDPVSGECSVVESPTVPSYQATPVYPGATNDHPLGPIECG